jgi:type II secretory pathway pseudopilin PulG
VYVDTASRLGCRRAFTKVELLVMIAIVAIAAVLVLPAFVKVSNKSVRIGCLDNLKQVGVSFLLWSADNGGHYPMYYSTNIFGATLLPNAANAFCYFQVMSNELNTPKVVVCPSDKRVWATNFWPDFNNQNISYFVGLDADETRPQMLLAGDRNLTNGLPPVNGVLAATTNQLVGWTKEMHSGQGCILLTDNSVQEMASSAVRKLSSTAMQDVIARTGMVTNRLILP